MLAKNGGSALPGNDVDTLIYNIDITGQVMAGNELNINGNVDLVEFLYSPLSLGTDGIIGDLVGVSAWQK